jgi:deazaflavin-dependent oxidoreductase (nitroreductase family)
VNQRARQTLIDLSKRSNPLVTAILRSKLHWLLSRGLLLITVTGRRSGRRYTIPVGYHESDGAIVVLVGEPSTKNWWRNYHTRATVELRHRGKAIAGRAVVVPRDSAEYRRLADAVFRRSRMVPRIFNVDFDPVAGLTSAQAEELSCHMAMVRIETERGSA